MGEAYNRDGLWCTDLWAGDGSDGGMASLCWGGSGVWPRDHLFISIASDDSDRLGPAVGGSDRPGVLGLGTDVLGLLARRSNGLGPHLILHCGNSCSSCNDANIDSISNDDTDRSWFSLRSFACSRIGDGQ